AGRAPAARPGGAAPPGTRPRPPWPPPPTPPPRASRGFLDPTRRSEPLLESRHEAGVHENSPAEIRPHPGPRLRGRRRRRPRGRQVRPGEPGFRPGPRRQLRLRQTKSALARPGPGPPVGEATEVAAA